VFFLVLTDPGVAVTVTGSPAYMAGGVALHARVIGGAFLQPISKKTKHVDANTKQTDFQLRACMFSSSQSRYPWRR
jgi:hypothetical protein